MIMNAVFFSNATAAISNRESIASSFTFFGWLRHWKIVSIGFHLRVIHIAFALECVYLAVNSHNCILHIDKERKRKLSLHASGFSFHSVYLKKWSIWFDFSSSLRYQFITSVLAAVLVCLSLSLFRCLLRCCPMKPDTCAVSFLLDLIQMSRWLQSR